MSAARWVRPLLAGYVVAVLAFLFAPIGASFVFSFNSDRFPTLPLGSFTLEWYEAVFGDELVREALVNSIVVSLASATLATLIGFAAAYTDYRYRFAGQRLYLALGLLPPTVPAIDHVAVAVDVLGERMHDHVGAELQRLLQVGRAVGAVDRDQCRAVRMDHLRDRCDVDDAHVGARGRLEQHELRSRIEMGRQLARLREVRNARDDAEVGQQVVHEGMGAAVEREVDE